MFPSWSRGRTLACVPLEPLPRVLPEPDSMTLGSYAVRLKAASRPIGLFQEILKGPGPAEAEDVAEAAKPRERVLDEALVAHDVPLWMPLRARLEAPRQQTEVPGGPGEGRGAWGW